VSELGLDPTRPPGGDTITTAPGEPGLVHTTVEILDGAPVLEVAHSAHGCWHLGGHSDATPPEPSTPAAASWAHLVERDPSLAQVAGLPRGWTARRGSPAGCWHRSPT
jgi:hypothetical protein